MKTDIWFPELILYFKLEIRFQERISDLMLLVQFNIKFEVRNSISRKNIQFDVIKFQHNRKLNGTTLKASVLISFFVRVFIPGGSLSLHIIISYGIKFDTIFKMVSLKKEPFSFLSRLLNALCKLNSWTALLVSSVFPCP